MTGRLGAVIGSEPLGPENLPISNNFQQTHFRNRDVAADTFPQCVIFRTVPVRRMTVSKTTEFLDNDLVTASR